MSVTLNNLSPFKGARKKSKRLGTGEGSGHGQTSTRGQKGQRSRSGDGKQVGFEGGQNPLFRRIPKSGFKNIGRVEYQVVNLAEIAEVFAKSKSPVTIAALKENGLIKTRLPVKVLGDGELKIALNVEVNAFSKSAKEKIEKAGGKAVVVEA
jgi:large subunit ribosomal protein L15